jgi:hypothetical protein
MNRLRSVTTLLSARDFLLPLAFLVVAGIITASSVQASPPAVSVSISSPGDGQTISGAVTFEAQAQGNVQQVVFAVDGASTWTEVSAPYVYGGDGHTLDTTGLSNGKHTLSVDASGPGKRTASASVTVDVENPVAPPPPTGSSPQVTTAPTIAGTAMVGQTLTASQGTWSNSPSSYAIAWQRCGSTGGSCSPIAGAASTTYAPTSTDVGSTLRVVVTASNQFGSTAAQSAATAVVQAQSVSSAPPQVVSLPQVSGTAAVGQTLTASQGTWSNSPTSYAAAWQRCDTAGANCAAVAGASALTYAVTTADVGATLRVVVTASNSGGSGVAVSAQTSVVPSPPTSTSTGPSWPDTTPPAFTPNRVATTPSEFSSIMGSLRAGDVVEVKPMTLSGEVVFGQKLSSAAEIHFDPGVYFTGAAAGTQLPAVWIHGSNLRLYGGDVSGLGNDCVRVGASSSDTSGPTNIRWWGAKLHDCGGSGFSAQASTYPNSGLDISVEIWKAGQNLALDPHAVKGSGLHGAYVGGGNAPTSGRFVFYVHDQSTGAAVQAGANLQNSDLWIRAERLTWTGLAGYGGNAFQPWGGNNKGVVVHDLEVSNTTGHAIFDESLTGGTVTVQYARAAGVKLSPVYESSSYVTCQDCK